MIKHFGVDIGNDSLKIVAENGEQFEIMNVVAPGYNRRTLGSEEGHKSNQIDVSIEADGEDMGRYFVGGLAYKEARGDLIEKTAQDVKALNDDSIILLTSGLAYANYDSNQPKKTVNIALGTALPTEEYFNEELTRVFEGKLKKNYKVRFNSDAFCNAEITLNLEDFDVEPEGPVGLIAQRFDINCRETPNNVKYETETRLGIFIGSITTEICVMENGEFNPKGFIGLNFGIAEALDKIAADIKSGYDIDVTRHQLDFILRNKKQLKSKKNNDDITEELQKIAKVKFDNLAKLLVNRINKALALNGINTSLMDAVDLGGGGALILADDIKKYLHIKNINVINDARFANANGCLISIKLKRMDQEVATAEAFKE